MNHSIHWIYAFIIHSDTLTFIINSEYWHSLASTNHMIRYQLSKNNRIIHTIMKQYDGFSKCDPQIIHFGLRNLHITMAHQWPIPRSFRGSPIRWRRKAAPWVKTARATPGGSPKVPGLWLAWRIPSHNLTNVLDVHILFDVSFICLFVYLCLYFILHLLLFIDSLIFSSICLSIHSTYLLMHDLHILKIRMKNISDRKPITGFSTSSLLTLGLLTAWPSSSCCRWVPWTPKVKMPLDHI